MGSIVLGLGENSKRDEGEVGTMEKCERGMCCYCWVVQLQTKLVKKESVAASL